jgi:hypothetical protein
MSFLNAPLALYSIPVAWFIANGPALMRKSMITSLAGRYDNGDFVATNIEKLEQKKDVPPEAVARVRRLNALVQNGIEGLPLYVGAVVRDIVLGCRRSELSHICRSRA